MKREKWAVVRFVLNTYTDTGEVLGQKTLILDDQFHKNELSPKRIKIEEHCNVRTLKRKYRPQRYTNADAGFLLQCVDINVDTA